MPGEHNERTLRFERLFERQYAAVVAYARRRADPASAEEAVSETFLLAWRRLDDVPDAELPWLLGVARRALANQRRSERRRNALLDRLAIVSPEPDPWSGPAIGPELEEALMSLSHDEREAILLVAWEGLTPQEAAAALGCSSVTFRVRLHRARRRLSAVLTETLHVPDAPTTEPARSVP